MGTEQLIIVCPCCEAKITLDRNTGAVLAHDQQDRAPARSFEQAMSEDKKRRQEAEDRFSQAFQEHENREEIMEKKFKEALERADKDDSKPPPGIYDYE